MPDIETATASPACEDGNVRIFLGEQPPDGPIVAASRVDNPLMQPMTAPDQFQQSVRQDNRHFARLGLAAFVTDKENAVMRATRMGIGEIGIRAFDPHRKIVRHEQVKDSVNAVGRDALAAHARRDNILSAVKARVAAMKYPTTLYSFGLGADHPATR